MSASPVRVGPIAFPRRCRLIIFGFGWWSVQGAKNPTTVTVSCAIVYRAKFMCVTLVNQRTGELKNIKVGFSWVLFLFSGLFGLPLFLRRLYVWGAVFLALWLLYIFGPRLLVAQSTELGIASAIDLWLVLNFIGLGLALWIGIKGNEMTAKNLLENGWSFAEPTSQMTRFAMAKWGLSDRWISGNREVEAAPPICETSAEKIPSALKQPISPVSVQPKPSQDVPHPSAPIRSPVGVPDSGSQSKSSNTLYGILAAVVTAVFALFVGILIGTHSKSPVASVTATPVGRAEIVAPEAPSASPAVQLRQEDSFVNTADSRSPVPNTTPVEPAKQGSTPLYTVPDEERGPPLPSPGPDASDSTPAVEVSRAFSATQGSHTPDATSTVEVRRALAVTPPAHT